MKKCFFCGSAITRKNGLVRGVQRYKCVACGRQFLGGVRLNNELIWQAYTAGKQTYAQLACLYGCSAKTIQRRLDAVRPAVSDTFPGAANVLMDTTYFGQRFGVMVFKDSVTGQILYKRYVKRETNALYRAGLEEIGRRGIRVQAIVCDGRKGLLRGFEGTPVQMCQFHQAAIIRRYLTGNPKLEAGKELWALTLMLSRTDKESFEGALEGWHTKWLGFINERRTNERGKSRYVHKRLRSAYRSLKTNLPWLFTWYDYKSLNIPNTTNALDGQFSDLKNKLRNHNGSSEARRKRFIDEFFKA